MQQPVTAHDRLQALRPGEECVPALDLQERASEREVEGDHGLGAVEIAGVKCREVLRHHSRGAIGRACLGRCVRRESSSSLRVRRAGEPLA